MSVSHSSSLDMDGLLVYRNLVEGITDYAIYMLNTDGTVKTWNAGAERAKGYEASEVLGHHFSMFYTMEDRALGLPAEGLRKALIHGRSEAEGWRLRKDGSAFWANVIIDPIHDNQGALKGFAKITRDCTEQRSLMQKMIESEKRFRHLVEGVTDYAIFMLTPDGKVANWNTGAERATGYAASAAVDKHVSQLFADAECNIGIGELALERTVIEGKYQQEGWLRRVDGSRIWASVIIDPIFHDDGELMGFATIIRDRTEQNRQDETLRRIRTNLDMALSHMSHAIALFDREGKLVLNNEHLVELLEFTPGTKLTGWTLDNFAALNSDLKPMLPQHRALIASKEGGEILQPFSDSRTLRVVHSPVGDGSWVTTIEDVTDRVRSDERISYLARHDALTDLANRPEYIDRLNTALRTASSMGASVAAVVLDLDRFKEINDLYGHAEGDALLIEIATRMRTIATDGEYFARFGGDEFVALKVFSKTAQLTEFLERLAGIFVEKVALRAVDIMPGASIGVAIYPNDGLDADKLINNADLAMYRAKASIDTKVCFYESEMDEAARERRNILKDIWLALENDEFFLNYQVQRSVLDNSITGYEALIRWQHPERGLVSPVEFIPIAEECGAIIAIGEWVLETACREAMAFQLNHKIAVNLSAAQLGDLGFAQKVAEILQRTGMPAHMLELEVTETSIIVDKARALHILRDVKALGVTVAIDDFGTGYSSLETLRSFSFDKIKLDRSFVSELETNLQAKAIIRAILALGKSLDVSVLAEGVETASQMDVLRREGCNEVQGFLFGRPSPLAELSMQQMVA